MIIYPPIIGDTIPGFTNVEVKIPFQQNPAVSINEVKGFRLKVKNYNEPNEFTSLDSVNYTYNSETKTGEVTFQWASKIPLTGSYYKFQLAYKDNEEGELAYSSAAIGRCIGETPTLELNKENVYTYQGKYTTSLLSEPLYSYRFKLMDEFGITVIKDTGEILYNVDNDKIEANKRISTNKFEIKHEVTNAKLKYIITTINGYTTEIVETGITTTTKMVEDNQLIISQSEKAKNNGYVEISLNSEITFDSGAYLIERKKVNSNKWDQLIEFEIADGANLEYFTWSDCSVEQGVMYQYALRNADTRYINKTCITADFEDSFLTDGERQFNIKYNPKISSFKNTILEQKTDTIGGKYPFFFRNGSVKYKEFPISGLLSYLGDEDNTFMGKEELGLQSSSINLTGDNIALERKFKLEALEWLTNGKPKLFRSPTEGNYLVRLMNVSLSPNETVGRMLHTFSATAYEIDEAAIEKMLKSNIITLPMGGEFRPVSTLGLFMLGNSKLG